MSASPGDGVVREAQEADGVASGAYASICIVNNNTAVVEVRFAYDDSAGNVLKLFPGTRKCSYFSGDKGAPSVLIAVPGAASGVTDIVRIVDVAADGTVGVRAGRGSTATAQTVRLRDRASTRFGELGGLIANRADEGGVPTVNLTMDPTYGAPAPAATPEPS